MMELDKLFLVGPMGAGKSTIGRKLAQALKLRFYDSDSEIEQRTGAAISLIFELEGETGFRARESRMIDELSQLDNVVLATGGGAVLDAGTRANLAQRGCVVYLHASVEQQMKRTCRDQNRPLLRTANPRQRLAELLSARDPLYREVADLMVDTDGRSVHAVAQDILRRLGAPTGLPPGRRSARTKSAEYPSGRDAARKRH